jgi:hypothetical protein
LDLVMVNQRVLQTERDWATPQAKLMELKMVADSVLTMGFRLAGLLALGLAHLTVKRMGGRRVACSD